jgi:hypothetical protein
MLERKVMKTEAQVALEALVGSPHWPTFEAYLDQIIEQARAELEVVPTNFIGAHSLPWLQGRIAMLRELRHLRELDLAGIAASIKSPVVTADARDNEAPGDPVGGDPTAPPARPMTRRWGLQ